MSERNDRRACYYCGGQANTKEHVPPKQMFKAFLCDSITVPSCERHNTTKGGHDQAIVSAFLIPLSNSIGKSALEPDVLKAIQAAQSSFERVRRKAISSPLWENPPKLLQDLPNLAYLVSAINIEDWIRQLTAALVYDGIQSYDSAIEWPKSIIWSPDWLSADGPASLEIEQTLATFQENKEIQQRLEQLTWKDGWSAYPTPYPNNIYIFQVRFEPNNGVVFKHKFYNRYSWYVGFSAPRTTVRELKMKLAN